MKGIQRCFHAEICDQPQRKNRKNGFEWSIMKTIGVELPQLEVVHGELGKPNVDLRNQGKLGGAS